MRRFQKVFPVLLLLLAVLAVNGAFPSIAWAADTGNSGVGGASALMGKPSDDDLALMWVSKILPVNGNYQATPITALLADFAGAFMLLGSLMLAWHTVVGMVSTAHEGRVLGQRWHQIWAPVRVSTGVALLAPVFKGLTGAHLILALIVTQSSSLASHLWYNFAYGIVSDQMTLQPSESADGRAIAAQVAMLRFCSEYAAQVNGTEVMQPDDGMSLLGFQVVASSGLWEPNQNGYANYDELSFGDACGKIRITRNYDANRAVPVYTDSSAGELGNVIGERGTQVVGMAGASLFGSTRFNLSAAQDDSEAYAQEYYKARIDALIAMENEVVAAVNSASSDVVNILDPANTDYTPQAANAKLREQLGKVAAKIASAGDNFDKSLMTARNAFVQNKYSVSHRERVAEDAKKYGWIAAGAYWRQVGKILSDIMKITQTDINYVPGDYKLLGAGAADMASKMELVRTGLAQGGLADTLQVESVLNMQGPGAMASTGANETAADKREDLVGNSQVGWFSRMRNALGSMSEFANGISEGISRQMLSNLTSADPIGAMMNMGHMLANFGGTVTTTAFALGAGGKVGETVGTGAITYLMTPFIVAGAFIWGVGLVYAYVLPLLPFIFMFFMALGWVILVFEAMIAVIIWAFQFIRMDGQEFMEQAQTPGAMILFNVFLRPTLGVLALVSTYYILPPVLEALHVLFVPAFFGAQNAQHTTIGLVGAIIAVVMIFYMHFNIIVRTLSLITELPDRIARWFGVGHENLREHEEGRAMFGAFVGGSLGAMRQMPGMLPQPVKEVKEGQGRASKGSGQGGSHSGE